MLATNLTALDALVVGIPLVLVLAVTMVMRRYIRSVADFLAASRCAGRYLLATAAAETGASVMMMIAVLEMFSRTGFSLRFWESFSGALPFLLGLLGLVVYRFRETRALTFHQFFEVRYSKGVRVFASFLHVFSGLFNFGVQPAVGARFFVYFCGLPDQFSVGGLVLPTFVVVMTILMGVSLYFALSGGQISIMVTDCLEGVISSFYYLVIAAFIILTVSVSQMRVALMSGAPGASFLDPFDIGSRADFNGWYVLVSMVLTVYYFRGNAWMQGFAASAKSAHEGRMAQILGNWRGYSYWAMAVLASIAAFTVLHHGDFAHQQAVIEQSLQTAGSSQLQTQMRMPTALGVLLAPGIRGAFLAVLLFGLLAGQGAQLHGYGSTILQDVILPLRKRPLSQKAHVLALRFTVLCVALFVTVFSVLFKPVDYLVMITVLIGAIYLGGIGFVVWGGLYWKRGTTAGAWVSLSVGAALGIGFNLIQQFWQRLNPVLQQWVGPGGWADYLAVHADKFPLNGQQLALVTAAAAGISYVVVSLFTCRVPFEMDAMLHRGRYRLSSDAPHVEAAERRSWLHRFLDIDHHFTRGDRALTLFTFWWSVFWQCVALGILLWTVFVSRLSPRWWFDYTMVTGVWLAVAVAVVTTVWFTIGVTRDLIDLFRTLKNVKRVETDDGTVRDHHNIGEEDIIAGSPQTRSRTK